MAYVTDDTRVKPIIAKFKAGTISRGQAWTAIKDLPPQADSSYGFLDWEVDAALAAAFA
ncbi:hypothetical protein LCGC14_2210460 [marine sediment metagenome]|uniref:Uncharacterized protein n=1 Tax=marine sediment metagenome TaxID=412755 RepID=A0A0F9FRE5_9ZZZZ